MLTEKRNAAEAAPIFLMHIATTLVRVSRNLKLLTSQIAGLDYAFVGGARRWTQNRVLHSRKKISVTLEKASMLYLDKDARIKSGFPQSHNRFAFQT
jgi:hypothetical protein